MRPSRRMNSSSDLESSSVPVLLTAKVRRFDAIDSAMI
jgi:hypothetical protein